MKRILCAVLIALLPSLVFAQALDERCIQNGPSACVDWDRGVVIAEGLGAPSGDNAAVKNASAIRAARLDAARNILEMIKGINLTSSTTMNQAMIENDTIRTQIQGYLQGLRPVGEPRYFSDGSVKLRIEARLLKSIPEELVYKKQSLPVTPPTELSAQGSGDINKDRVYSGLVVDARNTGVQPAMSPKFFDEQGNEIYGSAYVDHEFVVKNGMAGYIKDLEKAKQNDRVKDKPLVVKALKASGENKADLVFADADAKAIRDIAVHQNFLREARVVILVD